MESIGAWLGEQYGLKVRRMRALHNGADPHAGTFELQTDTGLHFVKARFKVHARAGVLVPGVLYHQGIQGILSAIPTRTGELFAIREGTQWIVYPFLDSVTAYDMPLNEMQWEALGRMLRQVHVFVVPPALEAILPKETFSPAVRRAVQRRLTEGLPGSLQPFETNIRALLADAAELAERLKANPPPFVLCHSDLHCWNVVTTTQQSVWIVDWDEVRVAPKEHDLMFVGGGVGGMWNRPEEVRWFYQGYGEVDCDPLAMAYYRCERILADLATGDVDAHLVEQFALGKEWDIARETVTTYRKGAC